MHRPQVSSCLYTGFLGAMTGDARNRVNSAAKAAAFRAFFEGKTSSTAALRPDPKASPVLATSQSAAADAAEGRGHLALRARSPPPKNSHLLLAAAQAAAACAASSVAESERREGAVSAGVQIRLRKRSAPTASPSSESSTRLPAGKLLRWAEASLSARVSLSSDSFQSKPQTLPLVRVKEAACPTQRSLCSATSVLAEERSVVAKREEAGDVVFGEIRSSPRETPNFPSASRRRSWGDLPEQLLLLVRQFASPSDFLGVSRRFAASVRRHRRALYIHSKADAEFAGKAALSAIRRCVEGLCLFGKGDSGAQDDSVRVSKRSSPALRLLSLDGSKVALSFKCLAESRSGAFPMALQVLLLRKCNKMTDRTFQRLILR